MAHVEGEAPAKDVKEVWLQEHAMAPSKLYFEFEMVKAKGKVRVRS